MTPEKRILAADVGGTKTFVGAFFVDGAAPPRPGIVRRFENAMFSSLTDVLDTFRKRGPTRFDALAVAAACPVVDERCRLTNLSWTVDGRELSAELGIERARVVNDLVATARGLELLGPEDFVILNRGVRREGNAAIIAAGTGLGEAILFWDGTSHIPSSSEGGHTDFGPRDLLQTELLSRLMDRFGHVSYERLLSGAGLVNIYDFFLEREGQPAPGDREAEYVFERAREGDGLAARALDLFIKVYGAEAGNLVLKCLAVSGLYVGGGIAPKMLDELKKGAFMESFVDKGRFRGLLSEVPVKVITNERTALFGAALYAADLIGS